MPLGVLGSCRASHGLGKRGLCRALALCLLPKGVWCVSCVTWLSCCRAREVEAGMGYPLLSSPGLGTSKSEGHLLSGRRYCWFFRAAPTALLRFFGELLSMQAAPVPPPPPAPRSGDGGTPKATGAQGGHWSLSRPGGGGGNGGARAASVILPPSLPRRKMAT